MPLNSDDLKTINKAIDELGQISYDREAINARENLKRLVARLAGFPVLDHDKIERYIREFGYAEAVTFKNLISIGHFDKPGEPDDRSE